MKTLILGTGNPILRDDGIGPRIVQELEGLISTPEVTLRQTSLAGMSLVELLIGFDRVIVIDAIQTGGKPGEVYRLTPDSFTSTQDFASHHSVGLLQAVELGKKLDQPMPREMLIVAIEAKDVSNFGEGFTPEVENAIPLAVEQVLAELKE